MNVIPILITLDLKKEMKNKRYTSKKDAEEQFQIRVNSLFFLKHETKLLDFFSP